MATTINGFTITSLDAVRTFNRTNGVCQFELDELQDTTISNSEDSSNITGKGGRVLKTIKKNKAVTVKGTSAYLSGGLMKAQTGGTITTGANINVKHVFDFTAPDSGTTVALDKTPVGVSGSEVGYIYVITDNNDLGTRYEQATVAAATKFSVSGTTLSLPVSSGTGVIPAGTKCRCFFMIAVDGTKVTNPSDKYSDTLATYIDCTGTDICDNTFFCQIYIPRGEFTGNFELALGGDQTVEAFELQSVLDKCSGAAGNLWEFYAWTEPDGE